MDDLVLVMLVRRRPHWQEGEDQGDQGEREQSTGQSILGRGEETRDWGRAGWGLWEGRKGGGLGKGRRGEGGGLSEGRKVPAGNLSLSSELQVATLGVSHRPPV